ncbi:MAG: hypothetical protein C4291_03430 [Candidatus Dadabacteria bacterium]
MNSLKPFLLFLALILLFFVGTFCGTNSLDNGGSQSSNGVGQIFVNPNPDVLFGNGAKPDGTGHAQIDAEIQVSTGQIPDGSSVQFELTGTDLPSFLSGCLINPSTILINGQALVDYVVGIFIPKSTSCSGTTPPTAKVNVAVTITDSNGIKESRFGKITLQCIGITPPADQQITTNPPTDTVNFVFLTLEFQTIGILPGTTVNFSLSRPDLGSLSPTSAPVGGSETAGTVSTQYTAQNKGGTQVITATITLPNPSDVDPRCPSVPIEDRQVQAVVTITQSTPQPTPAPSPGP